MGCLGVIRNSRPLKPLNSGLNGYIKEDDV